MCKEKEEEDNDELDLFGEEELVFDDRLNALIQRKLEEAQESLYGGGRRYSEEEVDAAIEKIFLKAEKKAEENKNKNK